MSNPFNPNDLPDEVLWELSDPDLDYDLIFEDCAVNNRASPFEGDMLEGDSVLNGRKINKRELFAFAPTTNVETKKNKKSSYKSHFSLKNENIPTQCDSDYWIHAYGKKWDYTSRTGKWLVFCPKEYINDAWEQIKDATEQGLLGGHSKVSTLKGERGKEYVCCVFTRDWRDEGDVMRVREVLRDLGFEKPLPYKTDEDTLKGKFANKGHKGISKYYE
jgi:hypothetical protein